MLNKKILILIVIVLALILPIYLVACIPKNNEVVKIQTDRDTYIPLMSSTVGIGLTPIYISKRNLDTVKFYWQTSYGYFESWSPPDFKVYLLGEDITNNGEKIYWTYDPNEMGIQKPSVKISLKIEDARSERLLTETSLEINWEDTDTAKVKK